MSAFRLKCKRTNSVEHERKPLIIEWLLWPEYSTSGTTMEIRGLKTIGCTDQNDIALVSSIGGDALWGLNEEIAVFVSLACLNQFVLGVVALELHNGTKEWCGSQEGVSPSILAGFGVNNTLNCYKASRQGMLWWVNRRVDWNRRRGRGLNRGRRRWVMLVGRGLSRDRRRGRGLRRGRGRRMNRGLNRSRGW